MDESETKHRRKLNDEQLEVLELLYKFRFGSRDLIASYFGKSNGAFVHKRLQILADLGYVGKKYDGSKRIKGLPAAYYLLPAGARVLQANRDEDDGDTVNIRGIYSDGGRSDEFIAHCMKIFALYNWLDDHYGDDLNFLTKSDIAGADGFPSPLPDAFFTVESAGEAHSFFVEIFDDERRFFLPDKKAKLYAEYRANGQWQKLGTQFPAVLFVCSTAGLLERAKRKALPKLQAVSGASMVTAAEAPAAIIHAVDTVLPSSHP